MWAGWVQHSWRFGHAEALREVGPEMPECGSKSQRCQSSEQLLVFFWHDPHDFLSRWVTMDETCVYHYDLETKQQSMEWWHSGSPHPKKFRLQKSAGKVLISIFGDQDSILLNDYLPKSQIINAEYYSSLLVQLKDILKEKRCGKFTKWVLFLHVNAPGLTGHLQPRRNWPTWASNVLITQPILRIWPRQTTTCSLDWKNNWKVTIFCPTQRSLLPRTPGWMDNLVIFFWVACKR